MLVTYVSLYQVSNCVAWPKRLFRKVRTELFADALLYDFFLFGLSFLLCLNHVYVQPQPSTQVLGRHMQFHPAEVVLEIESQP